MTDRALLDQVLMDADPARTPRDAKPDAEALAIRDRIISGEIKPKRDRAVGVRWATAVAAFVVVAGVAAFAAFSSQGQAVAGTPDPLTFTGSSTVEQIVDDAQMALAATPGPPEPLRFVRTAWWGYSIDMTMEESKIVPQLSTLSWEADQSGRVTIVEGEPYDPDDAAANVNAEVSSSGEVVTELIMEPGQFGSPIADPPGPSAEDMRAMLTALGVPADPSAGELMRGISDAVGQWTLTNEQEGHLLDLVASTGGATALGETTDRLGRPVAGISVPSPNLAATEVILISLETGRIVGMETTSVKGDDVLPKGAIIAYRLWDMTDEMVR
ncbi:hypothetical protein [Microbacterium aurantiacum]|uniref:hypothetical protein n=1 Tax=Microbacterium aurantiacum TaxID=162393 RepID=UPI000C809C18|nr:hypothetical protein [Microbacterium aurantiacum]